MGGNPLSNDILMRLKAQVLKQYHNMSTIVILRDTKTGEEYVFEYDNLVLNRLDTHHKLVAATIEKLAKEWPADVR